MHLVGIKNPFTVEDEVVAVGRTCAAGNQDVLAAQQLRSFLRLHLNGVRINKGRIAFEGRDVVAAKLGLDDFNLSSHDRLGAKTQIRHGNAVLQNIAASIKAALPEAAEVENRFAQGLAGDGSGMHANPADSALAVDDGD